mgnify:CR=1 FL=1
MNDEFVPVYEYVKIKKISPQNIYRWIRERKIALEDIEIREKKVKRIYIRKTAKVISSVSIS